MSESEIIKVYQEGIQSVISLVQGLSTQISELSQTVEKQNKTISDLDARLKKLEKQSIKLVKTVAYLHQPMVLKRQKVYVNLQTRNRVVKLGIRVQP